MDVPDLYEHVVNLCNRAQAAYDRNALSVDKELCDEYFTYVTLAKALLPNDPFVRNLPQSVPEEVTVMLNLNLASPSGLLWVKNSVKRLEECLRQHVHVTPNLIEQAKVLLSVESRFQGPSQQFQHALEHYSAKPLMEAEDCINDAVGALEATARVISGEHKALLSDLMDREPFRSSIHGALRESVKRIYGYRGDAGGVTHGQVGQSRVGPEEAEFILGTCASGIVFFVKKLGTQKP